MSVLGSAWTGRPPGPPAPESLAGSTAGRGGGADVETLVAARHGARVRSVSRTPSRFATTYPAEVISVELEGARTVTVFVKRLGAEQAGHPDASRRDRELRVYERLFAGRALPVPAFYGARREHSGSRYELFLEHIDDWNLKYHCLDHWDSAARALAELHMHFVSRGRELEDADFLLRLNSVYFRAWALRALEAVGAASPALGRRLKLALRRHDEIAGLLADQPGTLVHNDLSPKNVIAETSSRPARTFFVDWEMAGVGCGLLDLAHLKHGLSPPDERRLCAAYRSALAERGLASDGREFRALLAACDLHNTLYRLAHMRAWRVPDQTVERWVEEVGCLAGEV